MSPDASIPGPRAEHDARLALSDHVAEKALAARGRHASLADAAALQRLLDDREAVRYPTALVFDAAPLEPGEFALAEAIGDHPADGFRLVVHPSLRDRPEDLPLAVAYHIPPINYGDIASPDDCELFGAALLGLEREAYYQRLCALADALDT